VFPKQNACSLFVLYHVCYPIKRTATIASQEEKGSTMGKQIFSSVINMIDYIVDIRWYELPLNILYLGLIIGYGYCVALITIGFPCTIIEAILKKTINKEIENKIIKVASGFFSIAFLIGIFAKA